jgi:O-antigen/teichoic acid export membrane protein
MWMPYQLQLAHGWTSLILKGNIMGVVVLVPAIFWLVPRYGTIGAAWIWLIVNACYVLLAIHFMHRYIISKEKWQWYFADVLLPVSGAVSVILLAKIFQPERYQNRWLWVVFFLISGILALTASTALAGRIRCQIVTSMVRFFRLRYFCL